MLPHTRVLQSLPLEEHQDFRLTLADRVLCALRLESKLKESSCNTLDRGDNRAAEELKKEKEKVLTRLCQYYEQPYPAEASPDVDEWAESLISWIKESRQEGNINIVQQNRRLQQEREEHEAKSKNERAPEDQARWLHSFEQLVKGMVSDLDKIQMSLRSSARTTDILSHLPCSLKALATKQMSFKNTQIASAATSKSHIDVIRNGSEVLKDTCSLFKKGLDELRANVDAAEDESPWPTLRPIEIENTDLNEAVFQITHEFFDGIATSLSDRLAVDILPINEFLQDYGLAILERPLSLIVAQLAIKKLESIETDNSVQDLDCYVYESINDLHQACTVIPT